MYKGQIRILRDLIKGDVAVIIRESLADIRLTTTDNYQVKIDQ